jgi:hypothetical protein
MGDRWTQHVFSMLRSFCESELALDANTECFHRGHPSGKGEFLWDFIAAQADAGILIAAESEQQAHTENEIERLKHDFEKLLYVFAPIRILICKSKDQEHSKRLLDELTEFCHGCCRSFNQGAVFLVHFSLWGDRGSHSYIWQSGGEPRETSTEKLAFEPVVPGALLRGAGASSGG